MAYPPAQPPTPPPTQPPIQPRRRSGGRGLRITAIVLVSLLVLLIGADRVGDLVAENIAANKLQSSQNLPSKPDVDIEGFPFLTQFASRHYDDVAVSANDIPLAGDKLTLSRVDVRLHDLTVSSNFSSFHVDQATAVGTVDYDDLGRALGVDLTYVGDGKVRASKQITILGRTFTPTVTAEPRFADGALSFAALQATNLGPLADELSRIAEAVFGASIPLDGIPFQVRVQKVSLTQDGLRLDLTGADLSYSR